MSEVVEDRISNLPGSILHHILSFVDTREAAQTSVLSKRWKYVWRSIPILQFHCQNSSQAHNFIDFVDKTLELHDDSNIQTFILNYSVISNESQIRKWITTVLSHNVEDFTLQSTIRYPVLMPPSLFTCDSLIKLRLYSGPIICFPKYISLPRLERFLLFGVLFKDECWNDLLFSNCPKLQFLFLGSCTWFDTKNVCISNPSLQTLIISNPRHQDGFQNCALEIHAPSLEFLTYKGIVAKDYDMSSLTSLVEAHIDFYFDVYNIPWEQAINYGALISKFLRALAHVMYLTISDRTLQFVPSFPGEKEDDLGDAGDDGGVHYSRRLDMVSTRLSFLRLKFVSFKKFTGKAWEMRWLKLILKKAKALKEMDISFDSISHRKTKKVVADISSLPRVSTSCVLKFSSNQG